MAKKASIMLAHTVAFSFSSSSKLFHLMEQLGEGSASCLVLCSAAAFSFWPLLEISDK